MLIEEDSTITNRSILRQIALLGLPVFVEQLLLYLVVVSDTFLTGHFLTEIDLAAVTVSGYLFWFLETLLTIISIGCTAIVARMFGAGQREQAIVVCEQALALAFLAGLVFATLGWVLVPWALGMLNVEGATALAATLYLRIVILAIPFLGCTIVGIAALQGAGDTRTGMWIMVLFNLMHVAISWSLVRGFGPIASLGVAGVAIGTATSETISGLILLGLLIRGHSGLALRLSRLKIDPETIRRIMRISIPAAGESLANILGQLCFLGLINRLGPVSIAAHGVAIRCESLSFFTVMAFSVPASTLTGQLLGARRPDLAQRAARLCWLYGVLTLSGVGLALIFCADLMFMIFVGTNQPGVAEAGVPVLRVVAFAMPALATIAILGGSLRGAGDTRWPALFVFLGYAVVRLPLTFWLATPTHNGGLGWGLFGAWVAMLADLWVRGLFFAFRFHQGRWRNIKV